MSRPIITVDGVDGSGKSTFAARLVAELAVAGGTPVLVRVDDFRRPLDWSAGNEAARYYEEYYDFERMGWLLRTFAAGGMELILPAFDGLAGVPLPDRRVVLGAQPVLVIEGVFVRRIPTGTIPVTAIYLDAPEAVARARLVARDTARGRSRAEVERRLDQRYVPGQRRYHLECTPRERADLVVDNSDPLKARLVRSSERAAPEIVRRALASLLNPRS